MGPGRATLLLVEDDGLIRLDLADQLADLGFRVLEAVNADQALHLMGSGAEITAMLTDIDMPGSMSGLGLAAVVHARWPACRIVVISGRHPPEASSLPEGAAFLSKPITEAGLIRVLSRLHIFS